jgi:hypothetical protein
MSSNTRTAEKRKISPQKTKLDTEVGLQQHQRAMMKQMQNKRLGLYLPPRAAGITLHEYPDDGPNAYPLYLDEFNQNTYKDPMEYAEREADGLTFGGRRRRCGSMKKSQTKKKKKRSRARKSSR